MSFDDAGAPEQRQAGDDRVEPLQESFALALGDLLGEGSDVAHLILNDFGNAVDAITADLPLLKLLERMAVEQD
ncbi:hypothetical protein ACF073_41280 [Streptomyces sp. NPDC015171]|uniref:hypothetical protein n=1 Tax=Streptomyces sp. NPDC015171 TaxID=3364945 RepID=UPI0036FCEF3C